MSEASGVRQDAGRGPTFHHTGFVVPAIAPVVERFGVAFGGSWDGRIIHDPVQRVRVAFVSMPGQGDETFIELVEPADDGSPVAKFLVGGGGLHHVCFEVDSIEAHLDACRGDDILPISVPTPAVAFDGRRISWAYTPERLLIEYLERPPR